MLAFLCPHCNKDYLCVKNVVMSERDQHELYEKVFGEWWNLEVVPCNPNFCWSISGDFSNMTITPSVDASKSGHWHGFITNGEVR